MASVQEYVKKLTTEQLLSLLAEYGKSEEPWSRLVTEAINAALVEREKK